MENQNIKVRQPQFELLRIISMGLIVTLHFMSHGGVNDQLVMGTPTYFLFSVLRALSYLGVNCFVLISGYFMCETVFKPSRIVKMMLQVLFYSVIGTVTLYFVFHVEPSMKELLFTFFPISGNKYWFASTYIVMLFISPLLNAALTKLSRKEHLIFITLLLLCFSILPTVLFWGKGVYSDGKDVGWFVTLYVTAAYVKKYPFSIKKKMSILLFLTCIIGTVLIEFVIHKIPAMLSLPSPNKVLFYNNSPFMFVGGC